MKKYSMSKGDYIHKEYPKSCAPDDFWGQVKRTVNGKPVSQDQIDMIIDAIRNGLSLSHEDILLDIGCGNGALSRYFFNNCSRLLGIDFSEYLISVAKANFENPPFFTFEESDAASYVDMEPEPARFTKALCYGCFAYLTFVDAEHVLHQLSERFLHIKTLYIGNLPDKERAHLFYAEGTDFSGLLDDNTSSIGIWRSKEEMTELAFATGWDVRFYTMPTDFYAAHYRYEAILSRRQASSRWNSGRNSQTMKHSINDLALFGGESAFDTVRSTSNLLRPDIERFLDYAKTIYDTKQLTNNGALVRQMEERFAQLHGTRHCIAFCSGFMALMMAMRVCALSDKMEVVMPSLTYRRMADIAAWVGLVPHFCDVDAVSLGMTAKTTAKAVNEKTALILGVHPITNLCDIDGLEALSQEHSIPLLFDAVEAAYAEHNGKLVGGFGKAEVFSLHASKLLNGFEGGYVTTDDYSLAEELRYVRGFGFAGKDNIVRLGLNAKLNELHAAMALACLDILPAHISQNRARHCAWQKALADLPSLTLLLYSDTEPRGYKSVLLRCEDSWPLSREITLRILHAENMLARPYYNTPLHESSREFSTVCDTDLSVTEEAATQYILLSSGDFVSVKDITVMGELLTFLQQHAEEINRRIEEENS